MLILDNVDDAKFLLENQPHCISQCKESSTKPRPLHDYIPRSQNGSVLITTRSKDAALELVGRHDIVVVEPLNQEDALELFRKKLDEPEDRGDIAQLAELLGYMPLAIVQAGAYISQRVPRCSAKQYLEEFRRSDLEKSCLLDNEAECHRRDREAKNSIITTWHISFDYIRQTKPSAADLLSLMSFFDRQGIPEALLRRRTGTENSNHGNNKRLSRAFRRLTHLFNGKKESYENYTNNGLRSYNANRFEDDLLMLRNYSFVSITSNPSIFEMHRLVQLATRKWLDADGQLEMWKQQFIENLCEEFPTGVYENWPQCQTLFPHAKAAAQQRPKESAVLKNWASLMYKAAWYTERTGNGADAEQMSVQAMKARKKVLGVKHEDTL